MGSRSLVVIEGGKIHKSIAQCNARLFVDHDRYAAATAIHQSPDVDYVSRATESANAFLRSGRRACEGCSRSSDPAAEAVIVLVTIDLAA